VCLWGHHMLKQLSKASPKIVDIAMAPAEDDNGWGLEVVGHS